MRKRQPYLTDNQDIFDHIGSAMITNGLPDFVVAKYRPAISLEIQSWSYGAITAPRSVSTSSWEAKKGTLDDEAVFGPLHDYCCSCGKHKDVESYGTICDVCGVVITESSSRRTRFGHINLKTTYNNALSNPVATVDSFPVLPAAFREAHFGSWINTEYEKLINAEDPMEVSETCDFIIKNLLAIAVPAVGWNLYEAQTFIQGIGLTSR